MIRAAGAALFLHRNPGAVHSLKPAGENRQDGKGALQQKSEKTGKNIKKQENHIDIRRRKTYNKRVVSTQCK